jgi:DNA-binding CsgD family transcriptional regulator
LASAFYQLGEIERVRGNLSEAERAFEQAAQLRPNLGPGLARLRLAQNQVEAATATIGRMAEELQEPARRALALDAYVEIALTAGDAETARRCCDELHQISDRLGFAFLRALYLRCEGAVLIAEHDSRRALGFLREAWNLWNELQVPYEAARARCMSARAYRKLGDRHNAALERLAARKAFEELGAIMDVASMDEVVQSRDVQSATPLSDRELEVLKLVASGLTNRRIAEHLFISEKTVARHLSNIFTKLDLESRTAATAYAFEHKLV